MLRHIRHVPRPEGRTPWARSVSNVAPTTFSPTHRRPQLVKQPAAATVLGQWRSRWTTTDSVPLSRDSVLDLLYGRTPLIKEPGFLTPAECSRYEQKLSPLVTPYIHNTGPTLRKVGIAQFEYQAQSQKDLRTRSDEQDKYFEDAKKWEDFHCKLSAEEGLDAWYRVFNRIAGFFPDWDVQIASEAPGRSYFSGIFRALNDSTHLHCDFAPYDSHTEDWIINSVEYQIVFNLYLAPVRDGRTIVYDVQWTQDALKQRDPDSYGYHHDLVSGARKVYCEPTLGALCMFNSRNMHEVEAVTPEEMPSLGLKYRPRLCLSSFMGLLPSSKSGGKPRLIFWS